MKRTSGKLASKVVPGLLLLAVISLLTGKGIIFIEPMLTYHNILLKIDEAGDTVWVRRLDVPVHLISQAPNASNYGRLTSDGGFVLLNPSGSYHKLSKLDAEGNVLWTKEFEAVRFHELVETVDSGFIATGYLKEFEYNSKTFSYEPRRKPVLYKLDASGETMWTHIMNFAFYYHVSEMPHSQDGFVLTGYRQERWECKKRIILARVNGDGGLILEKELMLEDSVLRAIPEGVQPVPDGGFLIAGYCYYDPSPSYIEGADVFILKTDDNGEITWWKIYDVDKSGCMEDFLLTPDKGCILVVGDVIFKVDSLGEVVWKKTHTHSPKRNLDFLRIVPLPEEEYLVIGESWRYFFNDITLSKLNSSGTILWTRCYGDSLDDLALTARPAPGGGYIILGQSSTPRDGMESSLLSLFRSIKGGN